MSKIKSISSELTERLDWLVYLGELFLSYKKNKNDKESKPYKKSIELLRKLNDEKKKLAKEMDIAVSSKMRNVGYEGPLD